MSGGPPVDLLASTGRTRMAVRTPQLTREGRNREECHRGWTCVKSQFNHGTIQNPGPEGLRPYLGGPHLQQSMGATGPKTDSSPNCSHGRNPGLEGPPVCPQEAPSSCSLCEQQGPYSPNCSHGRNPGGLGIGPILVPLLLERLLGALKSGR